MVLDVDEVKKKIGEYFKTVTKEQLLKDLVDSGLEVYSTGEYNVGEFMATKKEEQMVIASTPVAANNVDVFCGTVRMGPNIVRASYLCGVENIRSANKESNAIVFKTTPTSASSLNGSEYYEYQSGT